MNRSGLDSTLQQIERLGAGSEREALAPETRRQAAAFISEVHAALADGGPGWQAPVVEAGGDGAGAWVCAPASFPLLSSPVSSPARACDKVHRVRVTPASAPASVPVYNRLNNEAGDRPETPEGTTIMQQAIYNSNTIRFQTDPTEGRVGPWAGVRFLRG